MSIEFRPRNKKWLLLIILILVAPVGGYYGLKFWRYYATHVTTDDAYVQANIAQVTPQVSGTVTQVAVEDNWRVKRGQILVRMDPRDYEVRLAEARANLEKARQTVDELTESARRLRRESRSRRLRPSKRGRISKETESYFRSSSSQRRTLSMPGRHIKRQARNWIRPKRSWVRLWRH